jgi:cystathionine gamma-synthase
MSHQDAVGPLGCHHHDDRLSNAWPELHPSTLAVTAGRPRHSPGAPVNVPVHLSSIFLPGNGAEYARVENPTWLAFEHVLGALEGGTAISFASGMAAAAAVIEMLPIGGAVVAPSDCYHGFRLLLADLAERNRIETRLVDISDTRATLDRCVGAHLLWIESPTNPLMKVADINVLTKQAHALGVQVAVDNTLATPLLQRPLEQGADLSVHSVTKLLGGHSDLLMGVAIARDQGIADHLRQRRTLDGGTPGLLEAFLALRGLRTLHLRVRHACASAAELAQRLERHPGVRRVRYPRLAAPNTPGDLPFSSATGGTLLSFEVVGAAEEADAVCAATELIVHGTSLGGVETLIDRRARWPLEDETPPSLLRLSVGCEYVEDLWRDLDQALAVAVPRR